MPPAQAFAKGEGPIQREALFRDLEGLVAGRTDAVALAPRWAKIGLNFCVRVLQGWTIDMIRLKMATRPPRLINPDAWSLFEERYEKLLGPAATASD